MYKIKQISISPKLTNTYAVMLAPTPPRGMRTMITDAFLGINAVGDVYSAIELANEQLLLHIIHQGLLLSHDIRVFLKTIKLPIQFIKTSLCIFPFSIYLFKCGHGAA